jgi:hypothetical protein
MSTSMFAVTGWAGWLHRKAFRPGVIRCENMKTREPGDGTRVMRDRHAPLGQSGGAERPSNEGWNDRTFTQRLILCRNRSPRRKH